MPRLVFLILRQCLYCGPTKKKEISLVDRGHLSCGPEVFGGTILAPGLTFDTTALVHNETKPITKTIEKDVTVKFINGRAKQ